MPSVPSIIIALKLFAAVVESQQDKVFLGVHPDLLLAGGALKAQLVKTVRLMALGTDDHVGFVGRQ